MRMNITITEKIEFDVPDYEIDDDDSSEKINAVINKYLFEKLKQKGLSWELNGEVYRGIGKITF